jgi:hypothetical protein
MDNFSALRVMLGQDGRGASTYGRRRKNAEHLSGIYQANVNHLREVFN